MTSRVDALVQRLSDPSIQEELRSDPKTAIARAAEGVKRDFPAAANDPLSFRVVVVALSILVLATLGAVLYRFLLSPDGNFQIHDFIVGIGSTALGALAGLLAPQGVRGNGN